MADHWDYLYSLTSDERRAELITGLDRLAALLRAEPGLSKPSVRVEFDRYSSRHRPAAEQIAQALVLIGELADSSIALEVVNGTPYAKVMIRGRLAGLPVEMTLWAEGLCEHRPNEKRKRDRWVIPAELVDAVAERNRIGGGVDEH
ncbi:hypothetical protein GCM10009555_018320 [Acrocarpospora macrocephala]|uniref:Uncharacterized protein n=1 Tax=Acrocarpospora macrocephala TaxID=150177 RepID=A0A5M3WH90_9ACTN|nr:hypothetical protein [Acrocarpospora macrocephala]GES07492.1 hypothetical protein Amac_010870 [Acrocarpospora macrocephala]